MSPWCHVVVTVNFQANFQALIANDIAAIMQLGHIGYYVYMTSKPGLKYTGVYVTPSTSLGNNQSLFE